MNNVTSDGSFDWSSLTRVPADRTAIEAYTLQPGDVVFNATNSAALVGKTALFVGYPEPVVFSNHFTRLRTLRNRLLPEYLAFWLQAQWRLRVFERICDRWIGQAAVQRDKLLDLAVPCPSLAEQRRIAARLTEQLAAVERARILGVERLDACALVIEAVLRDSLSGARARVPLSDCLDEVRAGVGARWSDYPVVGATRSGFAPAKEAVGKYPERYKPVKAGTVFYNPMRILLGSIAMVDEGEPPGITSPDYVVVRPRNGILHHRWFYYWLRSAAGAEFIKTLARGAVRERLLYRRLEAGTVVLPSWRTQEVAAASFWQLSRVRTAAEQGLRTVEALPAAVLREVFESSQEPREHHGPVLASGNI